MTLGRESKSKASDWCHFIVIKSAFVGRTVSEPKVIVVKVHRQASIHLKSKSYQVIQR